MRAHTTSFSVFFFFFFNDTATTEIYTLSLHDALPIRPPSTGPSAEPTCCAPNKTPDRKSTRLNSSHSSISYAVFCLKKKKKTKDNMYYNHKEPKINNRNKTKQEY